MRTRCVHLQSEDGKTFKLHADASGDSTATTSSTAEGGESIEAQKLDAESMAGGQLQPDSCNPESASPQKMPSSLSLSDSAQSASHSESHRHRSGFAYFRKHVAILS